MRDLEFTIPYPPSVNKYWKPRQPTSYSSKRFYVNPKVIKFKHEVALIKIIHKIQKIPKEKLLLELQIYPPDKRKRDTDNLGKAICDALQDAGIFDDDFQVEILLMQRNEVLKPGKVDVKISLAKDFLGLRRNEYADSIGSFLLACASIFLELKDNGLSK